MLLCCGLAAVMGHIFPVYLNFKGGKGVATASGVLLAFDPIALGVFVAIWAAVFLIVRYVSLASLTGLVAGPIYFLVRNNIVLCIGSAIVFAVVLIKHGENIGRLVAGKELKT